MPAAKRTMPAEKTIRRSSRKRAAPIMLRNSDLPAVAHAARKTPGSSSRRRSWPAATKYKDCNDCTSYLHFPTALSGNSLRRILKLADSDEIQKQVALPRLSSIQENSHVALPLST